MTRHAVILLSCLLFGSALLAAQSNGAMLYANGTVNVNGQPASDTSSVAAGDRVDVTGSSAGSINRSGSSVVISPNSSVQYQPSSITVLQGTARVSTTKGMSTSAGPVVVSPRDTAAKYDVVLSENKVFVFSKEGALTVNDNGHTAVVQPGSSTEIALAGAQNSGIPTPSNFMSKDDHPFYGVVSGVSAKPQSLPICANVLACIRPDVSKEHPCCCPPVVLCN
jgi:hypothetical protein